jgi:hypothetical protein
MTRKLIATAAACLTVAVPATASADFKVERARFKVKVTATQTTTWTVNRRDPFEICGLTFNGSGSQTMRLTTPKAAVVHELFPYDTKKKRETQTVLLRGPFWHGTLATRATVNRSGTMTTTPNSPEPCADGPGGAPPAPPASDCGHRTLRAYVGLGHFPVGAYPSDAPVPLTGVLSIDGPQGGVLDHAYENCAFSGGDRLLLSPTAALSVKALMGKRKRFTVRGKETEVYDNDGTHQETRMTFKVTFQRVAKGKQPKPEPSAGPCADGQDNDADGLLDDGDEDCFRTRGKSES